MRRPELAVMGLVLTVAERHRGDDDLARYLHKLARTLDDMLKGRAVRPWRLERAERFFEDLALEALRACSSPGCRVVRL